ncbi:MAG: hypothetical protein ACK5O7_04590 [Holosporales bacterium]
MPFVLNHKKNYKFSFFSLFAAISLLIAPALVLASDVEDHKGTTSVWHEGKVKPGKEKGKQIDGENVAVKKGKGKKKKKRTLFDPAPQAIPDIEASTTIQPNGPELSKDGAQKEHEKLLATRGLLNADSYGQFNPNEDLPGCEDNYNRCMGSFWRMTRHGFRFVNRVSGILGYGMAVYLATAKPSDATLAVLTPITITMSILQVVCLPLESMAVESSLEHEKDLQVQNARYHRGLMASARQQQQLNQLKENLDDEDGDLEQGNGHMSAAPIGTSEDTDEEL